MIKCDCGHKFEPVIQAKHRLLCGDSTKAEDVARAMDGEKASNVALVTDPPYGIKADATMHEKGGQQYGNAAAPKKHYAETNWDESPPAVEQIARMLSLASEAVIWGGNYMPLPPARCWLVWDKENGGNQFADCELAWTNLDKPVRIIRHLWNGMLREGKEERGPHPTQKPLAVMEWAIRQCRDDVAVIADLYLGSGTTMVAAQNLGKRCVAMEAHPPFVAVCLQRMADAFPSIEIRRLSDSASTGE